MLQRDVAGKNAHIAVHDGVLVLVFGNAAQHLEIGAAEGPWPAPTSQVVDRLPPLLFACWQTEDAAIAAEKLGAAVCSSQFRLLCV